MLKKRSLFFPDGHIYRVISNRNCVASKLIGYSNDFLLVVVPKCGRMFDIWLFWYNDIIVFFIMITIIDLISLSYQVITACTLYDLSHTWVRYPGFSGHVVKCPILTTVVPGFPAIWLAVPFGANGAHLGICTLSEKIFFVCEIRCFCVK